MAPGGAEREEGNGDDDDDDGDHGHVHHPEDLGKFRGKCDIVSNEALSLTRVWGLRIEYHSSADSESYGIIWRGHEFR